MAISLGVRVCDVAHKQSSRQFNSIQINRKFDLLCKSHANDFGAVFRLQLKCYQTE